MAKERRTNRITATVSFEPTWMPRTYPDPKADVATLRQQAEEATCLREEAVRTVKGAGYGIYELAGQINRTFGSTHPRPKAARAETAKPHWRWEWYEPSPFIATVLGGSEPEWHAATASWQMYRGQSVLDWVKSPADVARIPVPDWERTKQAEEMRASLERWKEAFPHSPPIDVASFRLQVPGGRRLRFKGCSSFIDLGIYLFGMVGFLEILAGDPDLAGALMEKCFALSTSYGEFWQSLDEAEFEGLIGFAGDVASLLSPPLYWRYSVAWDTTIFRHFKAFCAAGEDTPCNLHSCGPSAHLYEKWGQHPLRDNIKTMQTRLMPGHVRALRQSLPDTFLQLTFHPQHYDFARHTPQEIRATFRQVVRDVECRDAHFIVFAVAHDLAQVGALEASLEALYEELAEINRTNGVSSG